MNRRKVELPKKGRFLWISINSSTTRGKKSYQAPTQNYFEKKKGRRGDGFDAEKKVETILLSRSHSKGKKNLEENHHLMQRKKRGGIEGDQKKNANLE